MRIPKNIIKQQIVATLIILVMFMMVFGLAEKRQTNIAGTTFDITLTQEIIAGILSIEGPSSLAFNNILVGDAANSLATIDLVNILDTRGGDQGWAVTGVMNSLTTDTSGDNTISNASIAWAPGDFFAVNGSSNSGLTKGADGFFDQIRTLISAPQGSGKGAYFVANTVVNIVYNGLVTQAVGVYRNTLTLTVQ